MAAQDKFLGKNKGSEPAYDDDHIGGIGITIGTNISPEESLRLAQGPAYDPAQVHNPFGNMSLAELLRSRREQLGLSLDEMAETTRVRRTYLEALELETYDVLPSRAFSVGYVKSYAKALGLDEETLAEMFKRDFVDSHVSLRPPVGASFEDVRPNYGPYIAAGVALVAVIAVWNILQWNPDLLGSKTDVQASLESQPWTPGTPVVRDGVIYVAKPAAAPKDQDVPEPYATPGLEAEFAALAANKRRDDQVAEVPATGLVRKAFNPKGAIYGEQPEASLVTIQASRSVNLVIRNPQGVIYFAHQLASGEAYRVPQTTKEPILIDASDNTAFDVYYNGEYAGVMDAPIMPVTQLNSKAASWAKSMDAVNTAQQKTRTVQQASASASSQSASSVASVEEASSVAAQPAPQGRNVPLPYVPKSQAKTPSKPVNSPASHN